ncbi:MAG: DUF4105 domain-containing protein, partial [Flavobacteriaceae bacterium]
MHLKNLFLFYFLFVFGVALGQTPELSPLSRISVLTSGPGEELYSSFGHSAFRVQDQALGVDVVYNYGVFDPGTENFYLKFAQGRMFYSLARHSFQGYLNSYKIDNRWVKEQVLNLTLDQRNDLFSYLETNNLPENQSYQYDYFLNNCATKIWDILKENYGEELVFDPSYIDDHYSFRELIHHYINPNSWGAFGIDVALGSDIDRKATAKEHMYLPDYIFKQLQAAKLNGQPLAQKATTLFEGNSNQNNASFFASPLFLFSLISMIIIVITFFDFKKKTRSQGFDFGLFFLSGLAGLVLFLLWFLTDHLWTVNNFNLVWAIPFNLIIAFLLLRKSPPKWISTYMLFVLILLDVAVLLW